MSEKCPVCGAEETEAPTPFTTYACGSYDYDQRPGTFVQKCEPPTNPLFDPAAVERKEAAKPD